MEALDALLNRVSVPRLLEPAPTQEQRDLLFDPGADARERALHVRIGAGELTLEHVRPAVHRIQRAAQIVRDESECFLPLCLQ